MMIPEIETRSREEIRHYQEKEMKNLLEYLQSSSRFYASSFKKHKIDIKAVRNFEDLTNIPPTTKEDLQKHGPDFICVDKSRIVDYITTSGTLGEPVIFAMTDNDLNRLAYNEYLGFTCAGCTGHDIFQLDHRDQRFMAGWPTLGSRMLKSAMIRVGMVFGTAVGFINRFSPTHWFLTFFLLNVIDYAERTLSTCICQCQKVICIGVQSALRNSVITPWGKKLQNAGPN
jgi:phenylacetate-CoA ligase